MTALFNRISKTEFFLSFFVASLFIGIWHALPLTNVVGEEWPYVGGVLRAIESHTIFPHIDLSYIVSFYANYILTIPVLAFIFIFSSFDIGETVEYATSHFYLFYLIPRVVSVVAGIATAYAFIKLGEKEGHGIKKTLLITFLILSTTLVVMIMHTGKMWALTGAFIVLSIYFFSRILQEENTDLRWWKSNLFWCIGFSFLAFANFPFAIIALLSVPFLFFYYSSSAIRFSIFKFSIFWGCVYLLLQLTNIHGLLGQSEYVGWGGFSLSENILYYLSNFAILFPFLSIIFLPNLFFIKNKPLFFLALSQCIVAILMLSFFAPWGPSNGDFLRYSYFLPLFIGCMIFATEIRFGKILLSILTVASLLFFAKTLYLFSVPMTYNLARDFVISEISRSESVIVNNVTELTLPKNKKSYLLNVSFRCASLCVAGREGKLNPDFKYTVLDDESDIALASSLVQKEKNNLYVISNEPIKSMHYTLIKDFDHNGSGRYYEIGRNLGLYNLDYFSIERFGTPIFIYKVNGVVPELKPHFYPAS